MGGTMARTLEEVIAQEKLIVEKYLVSLLDLVHTCPYDAQIVLGRDHELSYLGFLTELKVRLRDVYALMNLTPPTVGFMQGDGFGSIIHVPSR